MEKAAEQQQQIPYSTTTHTGWYRLEFNHSLFPVYPVSVW